MFEQGVLAALEPTLRDGRLLVACAGRLDPAIESVLERLRDALPATVIALLASEAVSLPLGERFLYKETWHRADESEHLIKALRSAQLDAAIIFTSGNQSPYPLAYLCYLAGVPVRVGLSQEFGGGVLTTTISPPKDSHHHSYHDLLLAILPSL